MSNLRIRFFGVQITAPNTFIVTEIDYSTLTIDLEVDGVVKVFGADPSNANTLLADINEISSIYESVSVQLNVEDTVSFVSTVTYDNTFTVFGYDIGNNGVDVTGNPEFNIYIVDPASTESYANTIAYRRPSTEEVYVYNPTSLTGIINYYSNGEVILSGANGFICRPEALSIQQELTRLTPSSETLSTHTQQTPTIINAVQVFITDFSISTNCVNCSDNCSNVVTENRAEIYTTYTNLQSFNVGDTSEYLLRKDVFLYELINPVGAVQSFDSFEVIIPASGIVAYNPNNNPFIFDLLSIGDYTLKVTRRGFDKNDNELYNCIKTVDITACEWNELVKTSCGKYQVNNWSFQDANLVISKLDDDNIYTEVVNQPLLQLTNYVADLSDGVYKFTVTRDDLVEVYNYDVIVDCKVRECLAGIYRDILCSPNVCAGCDDLSNFKSYLYIMTTANTYFLKLQEYTDLSVYYEAATNETLQKLFDIKFLLDQLLTYCFDCDKLNTDCGCS